MHSLSLPPLPATKLLQPLTHMILEANQSLLSLVVLNLQHTEELDTTVAVAVSNKAVLAISAVVATLVPIVAEEHHGVVVMVSLPLPNHRL